MDENRQSGAPARPSIALATFMALGAFTLTCAMVSLAEDRPEAGPTSAERLIVVRAPARPATTMTIRRPTDAVPAAHAPNPPAPTQGVASALPALAAVQHDLDLPEIPYDVGAITRTDGTDGLRVTEAEMREMTRGAVQVRAGL